MKSSIRGSEFVSNGPLYGALGKVSFESAAVLHGSWDEWTSGIWVQSDVAAQSSWNVQGMCRAGCGETYCSTLSVIRFAPAWLKWYNQSFLGDLHRSALKEARIYASRPGILHRKGRGRSLSCFTCEAIQHRSHPRVKGSKAQWAFEDCNSIYSTLKTKIIVKLSTFFIRESNPSFDPWRSSYDWFLYHWTGGQCLYVLVTNEGRVRAYTFLIYSYISNITVTSGG